MTCSGPIAWCVLSKKTTSPLTTLVAPKLSRVGPVLIRSKLANRSKVPRRGVVS